MFKKSLILLSIGSFLISCESEYLQVDKASREITKAGQKNLIQGFVRIRLTENLAKNFEAVADSSGNVTTSNIKSVNDALSTLKVTSLKRTFPFAGRFEARTRFKGLHLWYDVYFNQTISLTKANDILSQIEGVIEVEYRPRIKPIGNSILPIINQNARRNTKALTFNDPMLSQQWHYFNDGTLDNSVAGADINVYPVWENYTTGDSSVIVSVVDGGIDYEHGDLAANIWINEAEYNGSRGVDDDKNGYVDDIRGFNFVSSSGNITPEDHGTHVAGTIGAVNNNGLGVCGIAGGDYANGVPGVRLMSCQIFEGESGSGSGATAIKYGADNGAVISQNSWGYDGATYTPASDKAAIDYFNEYAGVDENGNQVGPMKGGVVVFAAGNENTDIGYPGEYEGALAVSSIAQNYMRAYYSNYGTWVDIAAPGGDYQRGAMIVSTITGGNYGTMQGTSMACPHVSGVAALIVSQFGGSGFTSEMLRNRLVNTTKNIDDYNRSLSGQLGSGLVDALAAIASSSSISPDQVTYFAGTSVSNFINIEWIVPTDQDDNKPYGFTIYYSKNSLDNFDRSNLQGISTISFETGDSGIGDTISATISNLEFETSYNLVIDAYDYSSNKSELSAIIHITTLSNGIPSITELDGHTSNLKAYQTSILRFKYSDPDNHTMTWSVTPNLAAVSAIELDGTIQITIVGKDAPAGDYQTTLRVSDSYGASDEATIYFTIYQNSPPTVSSGFDDIVMGAIGRKLTFDLTDFFEDQDGETLSYIIQSSAPSVAHVNPSNGSLYITSTGLGLTEVTITAKDVLGETCSSSFKILVRDENKEIDVFPNPVKDILKLRMGTETDANVSIIGSSGAKVFEGNLHISPFNPAQINLSDVSGGAYSVIVKYEGKELITNIVKL